jgi:hypothetical protein
MPFQLRTNHRVCFTGKMRRSRIDMDTLAANAGLNPTDRATDADVLVIGDRAFSIARRTTKLKVAAARGLPILTETHFFAQIRQGMPSDQPASTPAPAQPQHPKTTPNDVLKEWAPAERGHTINF